MERTESRMCSRTRSRLGRVPRMGGHLALAEVDLQQVHATQIDAQHLEGIEGVAAELEPGALAAAPGLPVQELQPVGVAPVAEVGRAEHARALEGEGADVLDEDPALGRGALDVGQHGQPVEVPQAADHVIAQGLPLAVADGHAVLVLEQRGPLRRLPVDPGARALPLLAHLAHRVLDEGGLAQAVAVAQGQQGALDRLVDEPARPHLAGRELLEDVEAADERVGVGVPAAPGAVVLVVVAPAALLEDVVAGARPGEFVDEVGHG